MRKWGATQVPYDPWTKTQCLLGLAGKRGWDAVLLSDVKFESDGVKTVQLDNEHTWTIIVSGRVAVALTGSLAEAWLVNGVSYSPKRREGRALLLRIPGQGHHAGLALIAVCAPTTDAPIRRKRDFWDQVRTAKRGAHARDVLVIGGEFNADFDVTHQRDIRPEVVGRWGGDNENSNGPAMLELCEQEALCVADTLYPQPIRKRYTWWHPGRQSGHTIDHFLVRQSQKRFFTVHQGRRGNAGDPLHRVRFRHGRVWEYTDYWDDYTDHLPIELQCHFWPHWERQGVNGGVVRNQVALKPYISLLTAPGEMAKRKRSEWREALNANMRALGSEDRLLEWQEIVQVCVDTSIQVLGTAPMARQQPHLRGHEEENRELDQEVANALAYKVALGGTRNLDLNSAIE